MDLNGSVLGLLVTARDGRPVKVEGNPAHPASLGATNALAQAALLELYDPDRSRNPRQYTAQGGIAQTWEKFAEFAGRHFQTVRDRQGAGLAVLADRSSSPTRAALRARLLQALPQAKWYEYEPLSDDNERAGTKLAFGTACRTHVGAGQGQSHRRAWIAICWVRTRTPCGMPAALPPGGTRSRAR